MKQKCCLRLLLKILCFMLTKYSQSNILLASFAAAVKALLALCCAVKPVLKNEAKLTWQWPFQRSCYTVNMTAHPLVQLISDIFWSTHLKLPCCISRAKVLDHGAACYNIASMLTQMCYCLTWVVCSSAVILFVSFEWLYISFVPSMIASEQSSAFVLIENGSLLALVEEDVV